MNSGTIAFSAMRLVPLQIGCGRRYRELPRTVRSWAEISKRVAARPQIPREVKGVEPKAI